MLDERMCGSIEHDAWCSSKEGRQRRIRRPRREAEADSEGSLSKEAAAGLMPAAGSQCLWGIS